jgi:hypothetical protein
MDLIAPRVICVGTHHKTGTIWMRQVFRALADAIGVPHHGAFGARAARHIPDAGRVMLFQWSSRFHETLLERPDARTLHMIRDPRDVLLSGMRYHQIGPKGGEEFLHTPRADLDGKTYQEHLNALPTDADKLVFEMENKHATTLEQMLAWDYTRGNTIEVRYEDLMQDRTCTLFREALRNLGLPEIEVAKGVRIFWAKSLFGGLANPEKRHDRIKMHVISGKTGQWRKTLPLSVAEIYAERHGPALVQLGYETHPTAWVQEVRDAA